MNDVEVTLPGGLPIDGQWCRSAWLRPVTGHEEEFLLEAGKSCSSAEQVTGLICRCLSRIGRLAPVPAEIVRQLSVGDREALLLHLRRLTLGDHLSCLLQCPDCSKKMDLELSIAELLQSPYGYQQVLHEAAFADAERSYRVAFRLPNGEDQEAVAKLALSSVDAASEVVMRRCMVKITSNGEEIVGVPEVVMRGLPAAMAQLDQQAELLLDLTCPECKREFVVPFDIAGYFFRELARGERDFYHGVHSLSLHYHWSEETILKLSRRKRQIYLELLADDLVGSMSR